MLSQSKRCSHRLLSHQPFCRKFGPYSFLWSYSGFPHISPLCWKNKFQHYFVKYFIKSNYIKKHKYDYSVEISDIYLEPYIGPVHNIEVQQDNSYVVNSRVVHNCSWTANSQGFYYLKYLEEAQKEERIIDLPYNPEIPVDTWWDIGVGDSTVIWFSQTQGQFVHIINVHSDSSQGLEVYAKRLQEYPYIYRSHNFPHDMSNVEFGTGRSRFEVAENLLGHTAELNVIPKLSMEDGINAVRMIE